MRNIIILLLFAFDQILHAQAPPVPAGNTKISGFIVDSNSSQAIEFATVTLFQQPGNKPASGALAAEKGRFGIEQVAPGLYTLEVTFQTDYQTPIGTRHLLEFGGKGILRTVNSDYQYLTAETAGSPYTTDPNQPAGREFPGCPDGHQSHRTDRTGFQPDQRNPDAQPGPKNDLQLSLRKNGGRCAEKENALREK